MQQQQPIQKETLTADVQKLVEFASAARVHGRERIVAIHAAGTILLRLERCAGRPAKPGLDVRVYEQAIEAAKITDRTARRWQVVARIPETVVTQYLGTEAEPTVDTWLQEELSIAGLLRFAEYERQEDVHQRANPGEERARNVCTWSEERQERHQERAKVQAAKRRAITENDRVARDFLYQIRKLDEVAETLIEAGRLSAEAARFAEARLLELASKLGAAGALSEGMVKSA
jgi:hypothetical protein